MVIDTVASFGLDGRAAEEALDRIGITTNKQIIPDDPRPPLRPSGVRLGTPACTTRGMDEDDMAPDRAVDRQDAAPSRRRGATAKTHAAVRDVPALSGAGNFVNLRQSRNDAIQSGVFGGGRVFDHRTIIGPGRPLAQG